MRHSRLVAMWLQGSGLAVDEGQTRRMARYVVENTRMARRREGSDGGRKCMVGFWVVGTVSRCFSTSVSDIGTGL